MVWLVVGHLALPRRALSGTADGLAVAADGTLLVATHAACTVSRVTLEGEPLDVDEMFQELPERTSFGSPVTCVTGGRIPV